MPASDDGSRAGRRTDQLAARIDSVHLADVEAATGRRRFVRGGYRSKIPSGDQYRTLDTCEKREISEIAGNRTGFGRILPA